MFKFLPTFLSTLIATLTFAQNADTFFISGRVISTSGIPIVGASIIIFDQKIGTTCDTAGQFAIKGFRQGEYKLSIRSLGYDKKDTVITIDRKSITNIVLTVLPNCISVNRQKAIKDIKKRKAVLFINTKASQLSHNVNQQFQERYGIGFEFNDFGLPAEDCIIIYNQTVFEYLDRKFGKQWREEIPVYAIGYKQN